MGSFQDYDADIYFRNSELQYELSTATPLWGVHQMQGSGEMLHGGLLVPGLNTGPSYEVLEPNYLSYGTTGGYYYDDVCDQMMKLVEYSHYGYESNLRTNTTVFPQLSNSSNHDSGYKVHDEPMAAIEEPMKVGKYSAEERKDRILRYLKKRTQRNFNKTIKYACRKTLADKRVRVRGRFARNNELSCEGGNKGVTTMNNHSNNSNGEREGYDDDIIKIKRDDEEEWLQEAMSSLMYFPYVSG